MRNPSYDPVTRPDQPSAWAISPSGRVTRSPSGSCVIVRARAIFRTLGAYRAARFLRKRGWSVEAAQWLLLNR